ADLQTTVLGANVQIAGHSRRLARLLNEDGPQHGGRHRQAVAYPVVEGFGAGVPRPFQGVLEDLGTALRPQERRVLGHERLETNRGAFEADRSDVHASRESNSTRGGEGPTSPPWPPPSR